MSNTKSKNSIPYKISIFKTLVLLSIPTVLEEIMSTLLQYVDTAMVGRLGKQATAAVSTTTTVSWLVHSIPSAIGIAVIAMISQAVGKEDFRQVKRISKQVIFITLGCGLLIGIISTVLSPFIPIWMGAEESIQKQASEYFFIISLPMVFRCSSMILGAAIRATKDTKTPMLINLGANLLNVILNYLLIYTAGLGVKGAAISSAIAYTLCGIAMFISMYRNPLLNFTELKFELDKSILKKCVKLSLPVIGTSIVSCLGYVVFASQVTSMGSTVFAAHSIAVTAETIFYIPGYGLRTATSTLVGTALGENDRKKFETVSYLSVTITVFMMLISGLLLYVTAYPLMTVFTNNVQVAEIGAKMLRLVAFSEPFFGLMVVMEGIFYGLGRTKYAFIVESVSMWGVRILFTYLCVKVWDLYLQAVWYCMIADNVCKAVLLLIPVLLKKYRSNLFPK